MQGGIEKQNVPQPCAHAVIAQVIIVLLIPILTHESEVDMNDYSHLDPFFLREWRRMNATLFSAKRLLIVTLVLHGDVTDNQARDDLVDHQAVARKGSPAGGPPVGQQRVRIRGRLLVARKGSHE